MVAENSLLWDVEDEAQVMTSGNYGIRAQAPGDDDDDDYGDDDEDDDDEDDDYDRDDDDDDEDDEDAIMRALDNGDGDLHGF